MINRQKVIEKTFLTLGVTQQYNDNSNRYRAIAETLLDNIIEEMAHNTNFAFNQKSAKLNYYDSEERVDGEYKYNRPYGLLNIVYPHGLRVEGEFIYSENENEVIRFNQKLPLEEFPDNLINYIRYKLAFEISTTYPEFRVRQEEFLMSYSMEESKINSNETPKTRNILEEITSYW